ncbi:MAG: hypothetical protein RL557_613 [archaeon]|jgi:hypothetical protein
MTQEQLDMKKMKEEIQELKTKFEKLKEDLAFTMGTEEAWREIDEGKYKEMTVDEFLQEIRSLK